ncbi:MAG TPA: hypothetical protein VGM31_11895 [Puia sp.]|jgi:hypothetical protein
MKKWIIAAAAVLLLLAAGVYLYIPSTLVIAREVRLYCNPSAAFRSMNLDSNWQKWWPSPREGGHVYRIAEKLNMQMNIGIEAGERKIMGRLIVLPRSNLDSAVLHWDCFIPAGSDPVTRLLRYREARLIKNETEEMLSHMRAFMEDPKNVYGMKIRRGMSMDSALIAMRWKTAIYPGTKEIYGVVGKLRSRAASEGAKETDPPMLHVKHGNDGRFEVMMAIPVDKLIKRSGDIFPERFVPWKIIIGETTGGAYTAEQAMVQLRKYMNDHQYPTMAMPFQSLVTERDKEADTSRWVTRVIVPVP